MTLAHDRKPVASTLNAGLGLSRHRGQALRITIIVVLLTGAVMLTWYSTTQLQIFTRGNAPELALVTACAWALILTATVILFRIAEKAAIVLLIFGAITMGGAALTGPPNTSTDSARYAWDGIVQNAGISPYRYAPTADQLDALRPTWLFPLPDTTESNTTNGAGNCSGLRIESTHKTPSGDPLCTALNRPNVPTIYPPVSEAYFALVRSFVPSTAQYWPLQLAGLVISLAVTGLLLTGMRRRGINPRWAAVWGWSPFVASEAVTNSHVDVLGAALIVAATFVAAPSVRSRLSRMTRSRPIFVGALVGLAVAVKFIPAIAVPPLLRKTPLRIILVAIAVFMLVYVPYVLVTGWSVIGYLPGYLSEEGYDDGTRFALISPLAHNSATVVAGILLVITAIIAWWRTDPTRPWLAQVALVGTALLILSPRYEWYALLLIPFIALSARWEWLAVPLALTARTLLGPTVTFAAIGAAAVIVISVSIARYWMVRHTFAIATTIEETR